MRTTDTARGARRRLAVVVGTPAVRYLVVGGASYVVDLGVLLAALHLGAPLWVATTLGYWISVVLNFAANRSLVFRSPTARWHRSAARYAVLLLANYGATLVVVTGLVHLGSTTVVAKTVAVALAACWNYVLYRWWVFR